MWLVLIAGVILLFHTRKAGAHATSLVPTTPTGPTPEEVAAGWQQSAGSSPVPQEIAKGHQIAGAISGIAAGGAAGAAAALGLTAVAATGIGAVVAGAVVLIDVLRGRAHLTANDFVKRFQNPFGDALAQLIDPHAARMAAGTETLAQAQQTYDAFQFLWEQFQLAAHEYAQQSHDAQIVVDQCLHAFNGPNGFPGFPDGWINSMLHGLAGEIDQLAGGNPLSVLTGTV